MVWSYSTPRPAPHGGFILPPAVLLSEIRPLSPGCKLRPTSLVQVWNPIDIPNFFLNNETQNWNIILNGQLANWTYGFHSFIFIVPPKQTPHLQLRSSLFALKQVQQHEALYLLWTFIVTLFALLVAIIWIIGTVASFTDTRKRHTYSYAPLCFRWN